MLFCHKVRHVIAKCLALKKKATINSNQMNGIAFLKTKTLYKNLSDTNAPVDPLFKHFTFIGSVSPTGEPRDCQKVTILWNTGASQSLNLFSALEMHAGCGDATQS